MHGPESFGSLLPYAECGLACLPRLGVEGIEGVLNEHVFDFACGYVRFIQKRSRLQSMTATVWSLKLRVFLQCDRRVGVAPVGQAVFGKAHGHLGFTDGGY
jgi:hypothetical protein